MGTLLSDIGKTGPKAADLKAQGIIADIYAIENGVDLRNSLEEFLKKFFPEDYEERIAVLKRLGIETSIPMRTFYDLHSGWTKEVLEDVVDKAVVAAAASHHFIQGINPDGIIDESNHNFRPPFTENGKYDREEKLITLLDRYDAFRRRGRKTHQEAVEGLRDDVSKNFPDDEEFISLIKIIEEVLKDESYPPPQS